MCSALDVGDLSGILGRHEACQRRCDIGLLQASTCSALVPQSAESTVRLLTRKHSQRSAGVARTCKDVGNEVSPVGALELLVELQARASEEEALVADETHAPPRQCRLPASLARLRDAKHRLDVAKASSVRHESNARVLWLATPFFALATMCSAVGVNSMTVSAKVVRRAAWREDNTRKTSERRRSAHRELRIRRARSAAPQTSGNAAPPRLSRRGRVRSPRFWRRPRPPHPPNKGLLCVSLAGAAPPRSWPLRAGRAPARPHTAP